MKRAFWLTAALGALAVTLASGATAAKPQANSSRHPPTHMQRYSGTPTAREFEQARGRNFGDYITECPQAKHPHNQRPLDRRDVDRVEQLSNRGDDLRANYDFACVPQNETSIAVNPLDRSNMVSGANDYQGDLNQFDATTTKGRQWYGSTNLAPSNPSGYALTQSDPVFVYDRDGIAYNQNIAFAFDDSNGLFVWRSSNGGFTWSRPCVPFEGDPNPDEAVCGGVGDPRQPGDGVITWNQDPTPGSFDGDAPFDDKNWHRRRPEARRRRPGVLRAGHAHARWPATPTSSAPTVSTRRGRGSTSTGRRRSTTATRTTRPARGRRRRRSAARRRSASASPRTTPATTTSSRCRPCTRGRACWALRSRTSTRPTRTSTCSSARPTAAQTFAGPFFVSPVFDVNYPLRRDAAGLPRARPVRGRQVLTNSCFRVNSGGNVVVDKRGRRVRGRLLPRPVGQPQRDGRELEHRRLLLQVDERRLDLDRGRPG